MKYFLISVFLQCSGILCSQDITGAWKYSSGERQSILLLTQEFLVVTEYTEHSFLNTWGGKISQKTPETFEIMVEFNTTDPANVGISGEYSWMLEDGTLKFNEQSWTRVDDGTPGALTGAWIITGRKREGEMRNRPPGPRKTMKVLSGTRFQWIAYNTASKTFMGTGGGRYRTENGKYTEQIDFFSRDNSRVGAELSFEFELIDGHWHHRGLSSKGQPIYEIWSLRSDQ